LNLQKVIEGLLLFSASGVILAKLFFEVKVNKWVLALSYLIIAVLTFYSTAMHQRQKNK